MERKYYATVYKSVGARWAGIREPYYHTISYKRNPLDERVVKEFEGNILEVDGLARDFIKQASGP
ncbi:MAG: hypothetical protein HY518_01515 [Candidatus Aenigmarchaeota archaeon]|nr:hypothetical protein [Candidatus Aenigmarchaeota archaeon]